MKLLKNFLTTILSCIFLFSTFAFSSCFASMEGVYKLKSVKQLGGVSIDEPTEYVWNIGDEFMGTTLSSDTFVLMFEKDGILKIEDNLFGFPSEGVWEQKSSEKVTATLSSKIYIFKKRNNILILDMTNETLFTLIFEKV